MTVYITCLLTSCFPSLDTRRLKEVFLKLGIKEMDLNDGKQNGSQSYYIIAKYNEDFLIFFSEFLMPGLVDTHIHACQYPNAGLGYDRPLLGWLEEYTFPLEAKYSDLKFAKKVYDSVVRKTLDCGTTTACYFSTIHTNGSMVLVESIIEQGQRALVGKVNMNTNHPDYYGETTESSLKETQNFIDLLLNKKNDLVKPVITPRFAITCDMKLMKELASLAKKYDIHIQTHISENIKEISFVKELFPDQESYGSVYDSAGLLTNKTILAHGVHLSDEEIKLLADRKSAISHCPLSNSHLKSGICNVRKLLQNGVKVGLGTDISGGCSPSIIQVMQGALASSVHLCFCCDEESKELAYEGEYPLALDYQEVFYLATLGGAEALAMEDKIGNFKVGKDFDALLVSMKDSSSPVDIHMPYETKELIQKFMYLGDDRNIKKVFVSGRLVKSL
ncbi:hypothetical protein J437_LFUL011735 [Ladona fulva]|uniref:Guanine deaminase n=1 Tax=Ladona fulva TaxID=123851 RepID=A0A8K0KAS7_LADFU|nr:hypothetical protein J437_LFUL011735 [Ladona fulva]